MAVIENTGIYTLMKPAILTHPDNLFVARGFGKKGKETGEAKFSANFVFEPDSEDLKGMKATAARVARAKWPNRDFKELSFPFKSGDKLADARKQKSGKDDGDFQRGKVVVAGRSKYEPRLSGVENGKVVDYEGDARKQAKQHFYFGVEALAQFNFVAYDGVGANPDGITAYLNMVHTTKRGKRLAGGTSAAETFKDYAGHASQEDPTGGEKLDDEIPF